MHARASGLADYVAATERDALRLGRQITSDLQWNHARSGSVPARRSTRTRQAVLGSGQDAAAGDVEFSSIWPSWSLRGSTSRLDSIPSVRPISMSRGPVGSW
ncbi:hypothetical protein RHRU231_230022 [Rhodococcus ruber]|uniref:Uncharacterized protein n=1 Tax=Rhodococcus ruber TaxID=1830 RepID=A0A098BEP9_9NOCA|nr:hypothetical protein RHRU231_230022 [Rhodococcus ruber]